MADKTGRVRQAPIVVGAYDPAWPGAFGRQRGWIEPSLSVRSELVRPIEHIGSTAVPGLPAKTHHRHARSLVRDIDRGRGPGCRSGSCGLVVCSALEPSEAIEIHGGRAT